ncbi:hypothetical protein AMATHDRAFT_3453 [Amanita thiersii Skay4041]|uniref:FAD-binding domain-containing protein n=1 Tax=Amanita thiersii Skay4041 TaxID=703135 RepID=A0A2A9NIW7_9AGAR|nr:hypothetical protein AMATHDRAFT_3453 [Amanita thiersii Skay4041]
MTPPILIVGAGPTGLALALALRHNDILVRIIDKKPTHPIGQRGAGIMPRTMEAHNILGTLPDVLSLCTGVPLIRRYELPGGVKPIGTVSLLQIVEPTPAIPYPNPITLGQDAQERVLREHLDKFGCQVEVGTELLSFEQTPDGVSVNLVHHRENGEDVPESARFEYLLGADGAHSKIRKTLGLEFLGETRTEDNMAVGDIIIEGGLDEEYWHTWGDATDKMFMLRSTQEGKNIFSLLCFGRNLDRAKVTSSREEYIKEFYAVTGRTDVKFGKLIWLGQYRPNIRMVSKFHQGRVFLAGDAAHCHSPTGGQGMNSSFQDACNLGWKIALVQKGLAAPALLDTYDAERLPVIADMLGKTTKLNDKTFTAGDHEGIRDSWKRGGALNQLGVNYRTSPIIVDDDVPRDENYAAYSNESETAARAGDRAPDAPGLSNVSVPGTTINLFNLYKPTHHTVFVFSGTKSGYSELLDLCKQLPSATVRTYLILPPDATASIHSSFDCILQDNQGHAFSNFHVPLSSVKVFAIRPDGVVGAAVNGVEGLRKYFVGVFGSITTV